MNFTYDFPPDGLASLVKFIEEYGHGAEIISAEPNKLVFKAPIGGEQAIMFTGHSYAYR